MSRPPKHIQAIDRFNAKIEYESNTECWNWTGRKTVILRNGNLSYGCFKIGLRGVLIHRFSYDYFIGPIPTGKQVCHSCDNSLCGNPFHLFLGTQLDNMQDCVAKDRHARGARLLAAKLTDAKVIELRQRYAEGNVSQRALAREVKMSAGLMCELLNGGRWKHIPMGVTIAPELKARKTGRPKKQT